jgi:hypothetical protein
MASVSFLAFCGVLQWDKNIELTKSYLELAGRFDEVNQICEERELELEQIDLHLSRVKNKLIMTKKQLDRTDARGNHTKSLLGQALFTLESARGEIKTSRVTSMLKVLEKPMLNDDISFVRNGVRIIVRWMYKYIINEDNPFIWRYWILSVIGVNIVLSIWDCLKRFRIVYL